MLDLTNSKGLEVAAHMTIRAATGKDLLPRVRKVVDQGFYGQRRYLQFSSEKK
jgi:hypothetical protein